MLVRWLTVLTATSILFSSCSLGFGSSPKSTSTTVPSTQVSDVVTGTSTTQAIPTASPQHVPSPTSSAKIQTPAPSGGQTLTLSGGQLDPTSLDPALVQDAGTAFIVRQVFRGLVRLTPSLDAVPDLAEKVDVSADQQTYTFHLRPGLKFSNGSPLRATDVQYSLDRAIDPALAAQAGGTLPALTFLSDIAGANERAAGTSSHIAGLQVVDDLTLRIQLSHPVANFLVKLAAPPASVVDQADVSKGGAWWRSPNASGPFSISSWKAGSQIVLSGNQRYLPDPPTLKSVTFLFGAGAADSFTLYERKQVDMTSVPSSTIDRVSASNSPYASQLVVQPLLATGYILLNPNIAPFNDLNVRKAMVQAFDRTKIATVTFDGHVEVANAIVPPGLDGVDWSAQIPPYDPAKAKALLASAPPANDGAGFVFYTQGDFGPVAMKQQVEQNLGIKADVVQLDWPDYINDLTGQRLPALSLDWIADYPDPEDFLRVLFYSTSNQNPIGYKNPDVDRLLDQAIAEPDNAKRAQLYQQAQQKIIDDAVVIPLYSDIDYELIAPYVHGMQVTPVGVLGLESVWITK